jgi:hypothetical protein
MATSLSSTQRWNLEITNSGDGAQRQLLSKPMVQIESLPATGCKRLFISGLESGICGGSQPTLSAALATCGLSSESYAFQARVIDNAAICPFRINDFQFARRRGSAFSVRFQRRKRYPPNQKHTG